MRIADGVEMLEITADGLAGPTKIYPTLVWDNDHIILIDAGYPGQLVKFQQAFEKAGVPFDRLDKIIITHHDLDHLGGLVEIKSAVPHPITVLAHMDEEDYINGKKRPLKLAQMEANLDKLPEDRKAFYERFKAGFKNSLSPVDQTLTDNEELPYNGGIKVIFTPGHTLGHISLYLERSKTLVTGDALRVENGNLERTPVNINYDMELYNNSLKKLANYDIDTIISYHGGLFQANPNRRISELANQQA